MFLWWGWNWLFQICPSRQSFLCRHSHVLMFTCREPMVTVYMVTSTTTSPLSVNIAWCHHMFSRFSDMNTFIRCALDCLPLVHERGVYTVNYGTSTKSPKQWVKATTYILVYKCSLFSVWFQLFLGKWHEVKYWKKGGPPIFSRGLKGGLRNFSQSLKGGPLVFSPKIWWNPLAPPPTHI